ncbi:GlsB/YeaQ/YmgE family stress response membrane protein [Aureimonas leprariae]|uniref:GlsB/YeaQ/YmgE family stress response membrane protein n=1 Tax=Plantimonas leprariae TaxID=2615207 RepID=A0A7V7U1B0_9HYPH|nr:GlsB/YeaQ/YmgE family stress response membrane protein [Aureimonas leprariae]KAB0681767.1 GlsB/YeaQ/YmgE family stress response membrane protein [Aureimonas leprariae]
MNTNGVGWIGAIIIGGIAGWLAEQFMKSDMGVLMNIILGIVGAVVLNAILAAVAPGLIGAGWIAYLITGFIGACLLIAIARMFRGRRSV